MADELCRCRVEELLRALPGVQLAMVSLSPPRATLEADAAAVSLGKLEVCLGLVGLTLAEVESDEGLVPRPVATPSRS